MPHHPAPGPPLSARRGSIGAVQPVPTPPGPPVRRVALVLGVALAAVSFAAIFIRWADAPGVLVALYRMLIAALLMAPMTIRGLRRTRPTRATARATFLAGVALAVHFATWITSLSYTTVAASVSLAATAPLWVALLAWWLQRRPPSLLTLLGALVAVGGAAVIGYADVGAAAEQAGQRALLGDALALAGAVAAGAYLLLGRHAQELGLGLQAYAGSAYAVAAVVLAPLPALLGVPYLGYPTITYLAVAALAVVPQLIGHTGINYAAKHLDTTLVAAALLLEPIGAGLLALLLFGEEPAALTVLGAVVLLVGVALTSRGQAPRRAAADRPAGQGPVVLPRRGRQGR